MFEVQTVLQLLTVDPCEHCGGKDWDPATVLKPDARFVRDLANRPYAHMSHDEILSEHGRIYQSMSLEQRKQHTASRNAAYAKAAKARRPELKWPRTTWTALIVIAILGVWKEFGSSHPGTIEYVVACVVVLGVMVAEAATEICTRINGLAERVQQVQDSMPDPTLSSDI
jgi:type IV secretory pathway VirB2 component (pilin)